MNPKDVEISTQLTKTFYKVFKFIELSFPNDSENYYNFWLKSWYKIVIEFENIIGRCCEKWEENDWFYVATQTVLRMQTYHQEIPIAYSQNIIDTLMLFNTDIPNLEHFIVTAIFELDIIQKSIDRLSILFHESVGKYSEEERILGQTLVTKIDSLYLEAREKSICKLKYYREVLSKKK